MGYKKASGLSYAAAERQKLFIVSLFNFRNRSRLWFEEQNVAQLSKGCILQAA